MSEPIVDIVLKCCETDGMCACASCGLEFEAVAGVALCVEGSFGRLCDVCGERLADSRLRLVAAMGAMFATMTSIMASIIRENQDDGQN